MYKKLNIDISNAKIFFLLLKEQVRCLDVDLTTLSFIFCHSLVSLFVFFLRVGLVWFSMGFPAVGDYSVFGWDFRTVVFQSLQRIIVYTRLIITIKLIIITFNINNVQLIGE